MAKRNASKRKTDADGMRRRDAWDRPFDVRGLWWASENKGRFCRLPLRAEGVVRDPVWQLAQSPASARVVFRSDTTRMAVRVTNAGTGCMRHMAASGSNGLLLHVGPPREMRPWAAVVPPADESVFEAKLFEGVEKRMRDFTLWLPPYHPLQALEIGLDGDARVQAAAPHRIAAPVVFYGTSITQGGCASNAGGDYVSILSRMLDADVVNLGFSGAGRGEPEMAEFMAEIDASLFVLDYCANVDPRRLRRTLPKFVSILRERRPETPILLLSKVCFSQVDWSAPRRNNHEEQRDSMMRFYLRARREGDENIHFADGAAVLPFGADDAYVDGVHPTSHGFRRMAEALAPTIRYILGPASGES